MFKELKICSRLPLLNHFDSLPLLKQPLHKRQMIVNSLLPTICSCNRCLVLLSYKICFGHINVNKNTKSKSHYRLCSIRNLSSLIKDYTAVEYLSPLLQTCITPLASTRNRLNFWLENEQGLWLDASVSLLVKMLSLFLIFLKQINLFSKEIK